MRTLLRYPALLASGLLIAGLALVIVSVGGSPARALLEDSDGDGFIDTSELIVSSDPNDPQSVPEETFFVLFTGSLACEDGVDNDRDGTIDGGDVGCLDDDSDITSNQLEANTGSDPQSSDSIPEHTGFDVLFRSIGFGFQSCANEEDDDGDGTIDAADSGCAPLSDDGDAFDDLTEKVFGSDPHDGNSVPEHEVPNPGACSDGIDNDRDGSADGADPACRTPINDDFADAQQIAALPFSDALKLATASAEIGEPEASCASGFDDIATVWYEYTPSSDVVLAADMTGSRGFNTVAVWTRSDGRFSEVTCGFPPGASILPRGARAPFRAIGGETYYIQITGYLFPDTASDLQFALELAQPPANDNFAEAAEITSLPFTATLATVDATAEPDEPAGDCTGSAPRSTVWYEYTAPADQLLIADTAGSNYSSRVSIWTDTAFGLSEVACAGSRARLAFEVEAGRAYFLQIHTSSASGAGQLQLSLVLAEPPANDDFANATVVTSLPFEETVDPFTATLEQDEPHGACAPEELTSAAWYRITPQQSGYVAVSFVRPTNPYGNFIVTAFRGTSANNLVEVGCASPHTVGTSSVAIEVVVGQTYYFQAGTFHEPEPFTLRFELLVVPGCAPARFTVADTPNDPFIFGAEDQVIDATSISGGHDGANYCIRVQFADPLPDSEGPFGDVPSASIGFDTDSNTATGFDGVAFPCSGSLGGRGVLGSEVSAIFDLERGVVVPLRFDEFGPFPFGVPAPEAFAFALYGERSMQFIMPMSVLGDEEFFFAMSFNGLASTDCLPNGGGIHSPLPLAWGDINCDGAVNSLDSSLILQRFAGLLTQPLLCEYLGDVNQTGGPGPIDAVLILQRSSGLLSEFPGVAGPREL